MRTNLSFYYEPYLLPLFSETNLVPHVSTLPLSALADVITNESLGTQLFKNTQQSNSKPQQNTEQISHITYLTLLQMLDHYCLRLTNWKLPFKWTRLA